MNPERIPAQPAEKPKKRKIPIEGGGEISVSPEEEQAHEKLEGRRSILRKEVEEIEEPTAERAASELTDEERELLEEVVPDEQTRANLSPEVVEFLIRTKKAEKENQEGKREAA